MSADHIEPLGMSSAPLARPHGHGGVQ
jgi:hypothetical protein